MSLVDGINFVQAFYTRTSTEGCRIQSVNRTSSNENRNFGIFSKLLRVFKSLTGFLRSRKLFGSDVLLKLTGIQEVRKTACYTEEISENSVSCQVNSTRNMTGASVKSTLLNENAEASREINKVSNEGKLLLCSEINHIKYATNYSKQIIDLSENGFEGDFIEVKDKAFSLTSNLISDVEAKRNITEAEIQNNHTTNEFTELFDRDLLYLNYKTENNNEAFLFSEYFIKKAKNIQSNENGFINNNDEFHGGDCDTKKCDELMIKEIEETSKETDLVLQTNTTAVLTESILIAHNAQENNEKGTYFNRTDILYSSEEDGIFSEESSFEIDYFLERTEDIDKFIQNIDLTKADLSRKSRRLLQKQSHVCQVLSYIQATQAVLRLSTYRTLFTEDLNIDNNEVFGSDEHFYTVGELLLSELDLYLRELKRDCSDWEVCRNKILCISENVHFRFELSENSKKFLEILIDEKQNEINDVLEEMEKISSKITERNAEFEKIFLNIENYIMLSSTFIKDK